MRLRLPRDATAVLHRQRRGERAPAEAGGSLDTKPGMRVEFPRGNNAANGLAYHSVPRVRAATVEHALDAALTFEQQPSHWQAEVAER